jgi:thiopurine S-methyltransferase
MDPDFWHERWQGDRIGFHQDDVSPMLAAHWDACGVAPGVRMFVPLCGKSLDMPWLAARGHPVLGVELSPIAVKAFFGGLGLTPEVRDSRYGRHFVAGPYELILGDAFALDADALAGCGAVYDRAALIALPPALRTRYLRELYGALPRGCRGLLVSLEYPQDEKEGPPFAVDETEVRAGLEPTWGVELLERRDILVESAGSVGEGLSALHTAAYRLQREVPRNASHEGSREEARG